MKHFIFDIGEVLIKTMDLKYIYENLDWKVPYEDYYYIMQNSIESQELHKGLISFEEYFIKIKQFLHKDIDYQEFLKVYTNESKKRVYYKQTINFLNKIKQKGYKIYILSNIRSIDFKLLQESFDFSIFDYLFLSFEVGMLKPNDDIYQFVINKIGDNPNNLYFFDDREENIKVAKTNGINAYQVTGKNIENIINNIIVN